ncbi:UDP-N-acetylglucosamine 4/6-dehydratase (inverting) [Synechococcus sp. BIOS-U3-1]|uniref:UDP-N-acetylglucosamine 4,6-dehydratase (inverting) n=1 Tax=Synechococcus sp. BIOS-U3-1 TaxID=1400865 RepID=UPI00185FAC05|nr:UDP-N-acetylglucosamine 4,6-dehydratase (inverting) [Synechococcus sp. BIOS-U3-1]QNI57179.1 UDP-N-acetylglucosamine 4/6-dehydratase (inverting) [Synechococcus sp. BIOS-U3-1]
MKRILITGGTGSFGKEFVSAALRDINDLERLVIYSRDELKQWELQCLYPPDKFPQLRFFLGDVRDQERLRRALENVDTVVHAAALKQVPTAEYNPIEYINTNVIGAENVVRACLDTGVTNVVALSTDKAAAPINLYGATKLCSDKLFVAANNIRGGRSIKFSVVRYGNVMGSRGSVIPFFMKSAQKGILPITDPKMTRFTITLKDSVKMVLFALNNSFGGEIFVPRIPSYGIMDLAEAIGPNCNKKIIGIRPGEKLHEDMITRSDAPMTIRLKDFYVIIPAETRILDFYKEKAVKFSHVEPGFAYDSGTNPQKLSIDEIRELIKINIDPNFDPV